MSENANTIENTVSKGRSERPSKRVSPFDAKAVAEVVPPEAFKRSRVGPWKKFTPRAVAAILNEICNTGVMYRACHANALSFPQLLKLRKEYEELDDLVAIAKEFYREKISHVIHDRAIDGWEEPVYFQGVVIGHIQKFSDRLLELQAKRHCPEYRDKSQVDHNVTGGVLVIPAAPLEDPDEYMERLRKRKQIPSRQVD